MIHTTIISGFPAQNRGFSEQNRSKINIIVPAGLEKTQQYAYWETLRALFELLRIYLGPYTSDYITDCQFCAEREEQPELAL